MRRLPFAFALAAMLAAVPAFAQASAEQRTNLRGTVVSYAGHTLTIKDRAGRTDVVTLADKTTINSVVPRSLADIHDGDFIASTSIKGADGKLHAVEVQIFPAALKGRVPQLQIPWDLVPDGVMTNAIVTGIATAPEGNSFKLTFNGHETEIVVPPNIPIVALAPGDASLLKPGAAVFLFAVKQPDGSFTASTVTAEKNGVKPPM
jgi:hypothetical protein